jgi:hypothetical protein
LEVQERGEIMPGVDVDTLFSCDGTDEDVDSIIQNIDINRCIVSVMAPCIFLVFERTILTASSGSRSHQSAKIEEQIVFRALIAVAEAISVVLHCFVYVRHLFTSFTV